ncbi:MAG: TonB-dependent receptor [Acidobacteria bacterium]|nr:TonB-dependent receptor [Acidobacteriota bacterium]
MNQTSNQSASLAARRFAAKSSQIAAGLVLGLTLLVSPHSVSAQTSKGILIGTLRDQSGAVVPNATVKLTNESTGETRTVSTNKEGAYRAEALAPGKYSIEGSDTGFTASSVKDVNVQSTSVTTYDLTLKVGSATTQVSVEANQSTIDTDNGTLTGTISSVALDKEPIFSLNPIELATTVAGVQTVSNNNGFSNGFNIQVNGARPRANNFLLDGQEINDVGIGGQAFQPAIPDIFQSETVITSAASAEYGRAGGAVVNLVTQTGTNTVHGSIWERYTGSGLNSVPGGFRGSNFVKTRYDQHSYGFTAGFPIIKDKLFAFGGWQLQRYYGQETPGVNLLPDTAGYATLQTIQGAPAQQVATLDKFLSNGAYLASDVVYPGTTGPIQQNVGALPGCPATGCVITFAGFQRPNQAEVNPDTQWMYRVDYQPWTKDQFYFRYLHDRNSLSPDFFNNPNALVGFDTQYGGPTELGEGGWTHIFTPSLLNEFRVSEARLAFTFSPTAQTLANPLNSLFSTTLNGLQGTTAAGSVSFPTLGPNQNFPQGRKEDLYQFQDTIGYTHGRQSFRIGADIGRLLEIDLVSQNALGSLSFNKGGSGVSALGNYLLNQLGPSGQATRTFGATRVDSHGWRSGFFAQDDIKFSADLTVNLGLRYDYLTNPENSLNYPGLDISNPFAPINTVTPVKNDYKDISPRIGFAYTPHGTSFLTDGKTVIRGGFGIFYDSTFSNILVNTAQNAPAAAAGVLTSTQGNGLANASSLIPTISSQVNPLSSVLSEASNLVNPITYQYNFGVERELPGQNVLAIRYVGARSDKLFANQQYNYYNGATKQRIDPSRGPINARGNYAFSEYNAGIVEFTHNFSHDFLINANYVYGKDLDDGSEIFTLSNSPTSYPANLAPGGRSQDYGPSSYDHRQYFSVSYVYSPKGFESQNRYTNAALGLFTRHWTISGVSQLQSGAYYTFDIYGLDTNGDGSAFNDRPVIGSYGAPVGTVGIDGSYVGGNPGEYYDLGQVNTTGNLAPVTPSQVRFLVPNDPNNLLLHKEIGRNSYQVPGTTTHNLALEKGVGLSYLHLNRGTFIFRAEAQNVFNHNDSQVGDTSVLDASAGFLTPSRVQSNRTVVLWGKIQF